MLNRYSLKETLRKLTNFSAVGLVGPRQVGKTTLALAVREELPSEYLDLENPLDLAKLDDPIGYFQRNQGKLIILDEIQRKPELFPILRGVIDQNRRDGFSKGQFLILGSASVDLLRQSSESLAGRIIYEEMKPVSLAEYEGMDTLWLRGGFPDSLLADTDATSLEWRMAFVSTYLERDIPFFNPRVPSATMRKLWTMLGHSHGTQFNASRLAASLGISSQTVSRYTDLLSDLFLVRKLTPWYVNVGKRLTKTPKVYVRDSGILHALLNIENHNSLSSHPVVGTSWESFVIENIAAQVPQGAELYFYRTSGGAEIDLLLKASNGRTIAIEIKKNSVPHLERGFYEACADVQPDEKYLIYRGDDSFYLRNDVLAIGLKEFLQKSF